MTAVEIDNVTKVFNQGRSDEVTALAEVSLTVADGEFVSLIGPSGCGKSTLLRLIADLIEPTTGTVLVAGKDAGRARRDQDYGIAFQQAGLFEWRTVRRNVELPLELRGMGKGERRTRAEEMLALVGLADFAGHYPAQLSGGMQQRVAIARALALDPTVLLFDEPTSSLDPEATNEVLRVMRDLAADGMTMVLVTHEITFARDVADHVVFVDGGRVVEQGSPDAVLHNPREARTRAFLASFGGTTR